MRTNITNFAIRTPADGAKTKSCSCFLSVSTMHHKWEAQSIGPNNVTCMAGQLYCDAYSLFLHGPTSHRLQKSICNEHKLHLVKTAI